MTLLRGFTRLVTEQRIYQYALQCRCIATTTSIVDNKKIDEVYSVLRDDLMEYVEPKSQIAGQWFRKALDHNKRMYTFGRKLRLQWTIDLYAQLVKNYTADDINKMCILGFCYEFWYYPVLINDNIIDESPTYLGIPSYHTFTDVGMSVVNQGLYIQDAFYMLIKKYFGDKPYYNQLSHIFVDGVSKAVFGASLDAMSITFDTYTKARYDAINYMKSDPFVTIPIHSAMCMAGITDTKEYDAVEDMIHVLGVWAQEQDDYADVYGEDMHNGTDIEIGRCSWLVVEAVSLANVQQKQIIKDNYGKRDADSIARVLDVYKDLDMKTVYRKYEEGRYKQMMTLLDKYRGSLCKDLFHKQAHGMLHNHPDNFGIPLLVGTE